MDQSPSWQTDRFSASQEIPCILWNLKVHYRIYKSPPPIPILSQVNLVHALHPTYWRYILILSSHLCRGLPSGYFPHQNSVYTFPLYMLHASPNLILLDLISWIIFHDELRSLSPSLCGLLHSPLTMSLLDSNILLSTYFWNTLSLFFSLNVNHLVSHPYKTTGRIIVLCVPLFQRIYHQSLDCDFVLHLISRHGHVLSFSAFTSSPVSFLQTTKASLFFFIICTLLSSIVTSSV
jgi:hypothetical protein